MVNEIELMKKLVVFTKQARMGIKGRFPHKGPHGAGDPCRRAHEIGKEMQRHSVHPGMKPGSVPGPVHPGGVPGPMHGRPPVPPFGKPGISRPPLSREHLLVIISKYPDGVRQKAIADQVGINQSSTSELINKLEATGYIERTVDPDDKRATLLFLTEKGKARAAEVEDERNEIFKEIFSVLTEEEKETLSNLLDKLLESQNKDQLV